MIIIAVNTNKFMGSYVAIVIEQILANSAIDNEILTLLIMLQVFLVHHAATKSIKRCKTIIRLLL